MTSVTVIADDENEIVSQLINLSDRCQNDLILTTGGTGLSIRDVTPEATMKVMIFSINGPLSSFLCPVLALSLNVNTATRILESLFSMTSTVSPTQICPPCITRVNTPR